MKNKMTSTLSLAGIKSNNAIWYEVCNKAGKQIGLIEKVVCGADVGKVYCYCTNGLPTRQRKAYIRRVYNYYTAHRKDRPSTVTKSL